MSRSLQKPIVVIGGGIVGSLVALNLATRGAATVLVDARSPGRASSLSFAEITALDKEPPEYYRLACHGIVEWRRWASLLGEDLAVRWGGGIRWTDEEIAADRLQRTVRRAREHGYPVRMMGSSELPRRLPQARPGQILAASYAPEDGHVEPHLATSLCLYEAAAAGARVLLGSEARLQFGDDGLEVAVGEEVLIPSRVVLAAGAESVGVAAQGGIDIPMTASSGLVVEVSEVPEITPGTVHLPSPRGVQTYLRHMTNGRVLIGEESERGTVVSATKDRADVVLERAAQFFPVLEGARVINAYVVWRAMPADHLPIIGPLPGVESLYVTVMHSGFTLAPAIGDLAAQEILEGVDLPSLTAFRPSRFSERILETVMEIESVFTDHDG